MEKTETTNNFDSMELNPTQESEMKVKSKEGALLNEFRQKNRIKLFTRTGVSMMLVSLLATPILFATSSVNTSTDNGLISLPETGSEEENPSYIEFFDNTLSLVYPREDWIVSSSSNDSATFVLLAQDFPNTTETENIDIKFHSVKNEFSLDELKQFQSDTNKLISEAESLVPLDSEDVISTLYFDFATIRFSNEADIYTDYLANISNSNYLLELTVKQPNGDLSNQKQVTKFIEQLEITIITTLPETGEDEVTEQPTRIVRNQTTFIIIISSLFIIGAAITAFTISASNKQKNQKVPELLKPKAS